MVRTLGLLVAVTATLLIGPHWPATTLPSGDGITSSQHRDVTLRSDDESTTQEMMALCAGSSDPSFEGGCEDVFLHNAEDGTCVTNLGRPCHEAQADAALRRWVMDPGHAEVRAGDMELLEVIEERLLVVGFAFGGGAMTYDGYELTEASDQVMVVLRFTDHTRVQRIDGEQVVLSTLILKLGRDVVELSEPLDGRQVVLHASVTTESN